MRMFSVRGMCGAGIAAIAIAGAGAALLACGNPPKPSHFPQRAIGCAVDIYEEAPPMPTENIGTVSASCRDDVSDDDCIRTFKDEACILGADVIWGASPKPKLELEHKKFSGRAAHTKGPKKSPADAGP